LFLEQEYETALKNKELARKPYPYRPAMLPARAPLAVLPSDNPIDLWLRLAYFGSSIAA
jgi:hypothetical protein